MEEDDLDFTPSPNTSSNLASLFTNKPLKGNSSLTYTAPKPPKRESSPVKKKPDEKTREKIIFSKAVRAYKLQNRNYTNQGLIGLVISGNHNSKIYEIILYNKTKEYLCQIRISNSFSITLFANNYVSFYDNNQQNWSIMFDSNVDVEQFSQKVAICKFYSNSESKDVLFQDLAPPSQQKVNENSFEILYDCFILSPEEIIKLKGDIIERIELSDHKFPALSKGLTGITTNCKRVIIIPHSLAGPWLDKLDSNKDLLIEVKVEKIMLELENLPESQLFNDVSPESSMDSSTEETSIKARGASIKEALSSSKSQKANLISRMARMGQATLPVKQSLSGSQSDSKEEVSGISSPKPRLPRTRNTVSSTPINSFSHIQNPDTSHQVALYQSDLPWHQAQLGKLGIPYPQIMPVTASPTSSPTDQNMSVYISESRIQAAELRMGISKISEKLDLVWSTIQNLNGAGNERKINQQALLDSGGLITSIQNLISENESLKEKVEEQKEKIEQQNDRIFHLLELNQKYLDRNFTSQEKQSASESKLKTEMESLQKKELEMETANKVALDKVKNLEDDLVKSEKLNKELRKKVDDLTEEMEGLRKRLKENNEMLDEMDSFKSKLMRSAETILKLKEKLKEVMSENENYKSVIKTQKEEIETGSQKVEDSRTKNKEYEKAVESLKRQISEEETKTESKIESLTKIVAKLEEEKKSLMETIEKKNTESELNNILPKILSVLKKQFPQGKEYSASQILTITEVIFNKVIAKGSVEEETITVETSPEPTVVPVPRSSLLTTEPSPKEKEEEKKETDSQKKKNEVDSRYKSYDQGWRTDKPPPPPLFVDDDDEDDYLS